MTGRSRAPLPRRHKRSRRPRGALAAIGGLLVASAFVRAATGAGEALAREADEPSPAELTATASAGMEKGDEEPTVIRVTESELKPMLDALNAREARLEKREEALAVRMRALDLAEAEIDKKLVQLERAEESLRETMTLASTAAEDDVTRLTDVYASMKPKRAAALFEEMTPEFAAGFLGRMRPEAAAEIMAGLSPQAAYTISVVLAGRNAAVPTE